MWLAVTFSTVAAAGLRLALRFELEARQFEHEHTRRLACFVRCERIERGMADVAMTVERPAARVSVPSAMRRSSCRSCR